MKIKSTEYKLNAALDVAPKLKDIITRLNGYAHACRRTTGKVLGKLIPARLHDAPLMIVHSKRMCDEWRGKIFGGRPYFSVNALEVWNRSRPYWTWEGPELTLGFNAVHITEVLCDAHEEELPLLILWVGENVLTLDKFAVDQDYLDHVTEAWSGSYLPRFVPEKSYVDAKLAALPPALSPDEECFVGHEGLPVYVVTFC
jgi:hypothetical protein